jgi:2'-5' RNA ligase
MKPEFLIKVPGFNYFEYLLVITPHPTLCDKIMEEKKEFAVRFKTPLAYKTLPHITLVNFLQFEIREKYIINHLQKIAAEYHPVSVKLEGFGSFPSHTIYINIQSMQQIQNLVKELKGAQQVMTLDKNNKPHFITNPHLTVARKLLPWQYEKAWPEYSERNFSGYFISREMVLLKRTLDIQQDGKITTGKYRQAGRFSFMGLPVQKQGSLFV